MAKTPDLAAAVTCALRAPSVHNTQPWRWRIHAAEVELHADFNRHLPYTDPDRRDLVISCGAALHHLRVALAARDLAVAVARLPSPENLGHLATVTVRPGLGDAQAASLYPAIARRRTERRRMSHRPVPESAFRKCADHASREGAALFPIAPALQQRLRAVLAEAGREQHLTPGYAAELEIWTRRYAGSRDGVSGQSVAERPAGLVDASPLRRFPRGELRQPHQPSGSAPADDAAELLVLATQADDCLAWLRAGEATSAVLLAATLLGLATTPLSQAVEVATIRRQLRQTVLHTPRHPQLILRIGWPADGAGELPATARRDLHSVLQRS